MEANLGMKLDQSVRWKLRHRMADWLVSSKQLIGKSRKEVVAMLGEPPSTNYFNGWSMVYNLGAERGYISIDSEWLLLRIGETGLVTEAPVGRD